MTEDISSNKGSSSVHDCSNAFESTVVNLGDDINRNNINGEIAGQSVFVNTCESASDKKSFHITSVTLQRNSTDGNADESADESRTEEFPDNIDMSADVRAETPRHAEHVVRKEDVLYRVTSVGSAPIIPTSTQYGIAVVSNPNADHIDNVIKFAANDKNTDFVIRNDCLQNGFEKSCGISANLSAREFNAKNERFKVVKIESNEPFKRGRWVCMDFLDTSMDQVKKSSVITNDRESEKGTQKADLPSNGVTNSDNMTANNDKCSKGVNESEKPAPVAQAVDSVNQMNGDISSSVSPNQTFNAPFIPPSNVTQPQAQSLTHIIIPQPTQPQVASGSYGHSQSLPQTDLQHVHQTSAPQQQQPQQQQSQQQQPVHVVSSLQQSFHTNIQHPPGLIGSGVSNVQNISHQQQHQPDVYNQNAQQQMTMQQQPAVIQQQYQAMPQQASQPRISVPTSQSQSVPAQSQQGPNPHCMPQIPMAQSNQQPANPPPSNEIAQQVPLTQPQNNQPNLGQQYQQPQPSGQAPLQHSIPQIPIQQQTFQQPTAQPQMIHQSVSQQIPVQHQHNQGPVQSMPVSQQASNIHQNSSQQGNIPQQAVISNVNSHMPPQAAVGQPPLQSSFLPQQQNTLQQTVIHQQPASQSSAQQVLPQPSQLIQSQIASNSDQQIHMQPMHQQQQPQIIQQQSVPSQISQPPPQLQQPAPPQSIPTHQQQMQHMPQPNNAPPQQPQQQPQTMPQHSQQSQQTAQQLPQQMQPQQMQPQQMQTQQIQPPVQQIQLQQQQQIQQQQTQNGQQQIHHQQVLQQPVAQPQQQQQQPQPQQQQPQQQQQQPQQQTHQLMQGAPTNLPHQSVQQPQSFQSSVQQTMAQSNQPPPQSQSNQPSMLPNVQSGIMTQCLQQTQQIASQQPLPPQQHQIQPKPGSLQQPSQAPMQSSQSIQHSLPQNVPPAQNIQQQPQPVQQQQPYQPVVTHQTAPIQMSDPSNIPVPTSQAGYQVDVMLPSMSQTDVLLASNQNQQFALAQQQPSQNIPVQAQMPLHVSIQQSYQNAPPPNYVNASGLNLMASTGNTSIGHQQQQTPPLSQQSYYSHAPVSQPMVQKTCTAQTLSSAAVTSQDLQHLCAHPHQIMSSVAQPTLMAVGAVQGIQSAGAGQNANVNLPLQGQQQQQVPYSMQSQSVYVQSGGPVMSSAQVSANAQTQTAGMVSVGVPLQQAPPQLQQPPYAVPSAPLSSTSFTSNVVHPAQLQQSIYNVPGSQMYGGAGNQPAPAVPFAEMVGIDPQQLAYPSPQFTEQVCDVVRGTDEMANQQRPPEDVDSTASNNNAVAIDNKIEQAMDLVKSHLMFAVREEVEVLKEKIAELMDRINQLEVENSILKANASPETIELLPKHASSTASSAPSVPSSQSQPPTAPTNGQPP